MGMYVLDHAGDHPFRYEHHIYVTPQYWYVVEAVARFVQDYEYWKKNVSSWSGYDMLFGLEYARLCRLYHDVLRSLYQIVYDRYVVQYSVECQELLHNHNLPNIIYKITHAAVVFSGTKP